MTTESHATPRRAANPTVAAPASEPIDTGAMLAAALARHRAGALAEAEAVYRRILEREPEHFDCLHLLGVIFHQRGQHAAAVQQIDRALGKDPNNILALNNRGIALNELKRFDEALENYDRALTVQPNYPDALSNRAAALFALKRFDEALESSDRALAGRPDYPEALVNRGNALKELKRFADALASYDRALALRPKYAEAWSNRGNALKEMLRFEDALASYDRALSLRPDLVDALSNRGAALHELKRHDEAVASCDGALSLRPNFAEAHANRANALHALKRYDEALASSDRALALRPDLAEGHYNRGNALHRLQRFDEAVASFDRALAQDPHYAEAHSNRGMALQELGRFAEAIQSYQSAFAERPDFADASYNEALCRLLIGDLRSGWEKHERRWGTEQLRYGTRDFSQPLWLGAEDIRGRTMLLHAEQGFGDTIQFCRYAPLVAAQGGRVVLEVQKPLQALARSLSGVSEVVARGDHLPDFDLHCPLLSLPLAFKTELATIPRETPYLYAAPTAVQQWRDRLGRKDRIRIGIAWSGRPAHKNDHNRSMALGPFVSCLEGIDATLVSLQPDVRPADAVVLKDRRDILSFGAELKDFSDTAALIANLDLVVCVDTSVAHLAGALAKPVWVLLPFLPDWRWLLGREDSPWYPTARLFRQDATRSWASVEPRVRAALREFVRAA